MLEVAVRVRKGAFMLISFLRVTKHKYSNLLSNNVIVQHNFCVCESTQKSNFASEALIEQNPITAWIPVSSRRFKIQKLKQDYHIFYCQGEGQILQNKYLHTAFPRISVNNRNKECEANIRNAAAACAGGSSGHGFPLWHIPCTWNCCITQEAQLKHTATSTRL